MGVWVCGNVARVDVGVWVHVGVWTCRTCGCAGMGECECECNCDLYMWELRC